MTNIYSQTTSNDLTKIHNLGHVLYKTGIYIQQTIAKYVQLNMMSDRILILEHNPVFSLGRNANYNDIHIDNCQLVKLGIETHSTNRGGQVTYHGPGQIIVYPIFNLKNKQKQIKLLIYNLEEVMIRTAKDFDITATRLKKYPGIWVTTNNGTAKLGAIGLHLHKWVSTHGMAFNVNPDLDSFKLITPCGISNKGVCSLKSLLNSSAPTWHQTVDRIKFHLQSIFEAQFNIKEQPKIQLSLIPWRLTDAGLQYLYNNQMFIPVLAYDATSNIQLCYDYAISIFKEMIGLIGEFKVNKLDFTQTNLYQPHMLKHGKIEPLFNQSEYLAIKLDANVYEKINDNSSLQWYTFHEVQQKLSDMDTKITFDFIHKSIKNNLVNI